MLLEDVCSLFNLCFDCFLRFLITTGTFFALFPSDKTRLWYKDEQQHNKLWFEVGTEVVSLKAFSKSSQSGRQEITNPNRSAGSLKALH